MIRIRFQETTKINYIVLERGKEVTSQVAMDAGDVMHVEGIDNNYKTNENLARVNVNDFEWFICERAEFRVFDLGG